MGANRGKGVPKALKVQGKQANGILNGKPGLCRPEQARKAAEPVGGEALRRLVPKHWPFRGFGGDRRAKLGGLARQVAAEKPRGRIVQSAEAEIEKKQEKKTSIVPLIQFNPMVSLVKFP